MAVRVYHDRAALLDAGLALGEEEGLLASSFKSWEAIEEEVWHAPLVTVHPHPL